MGSGRPERSVSVEAGEGCWRGQFLAMASPCEVLCETDDPEEAKRLTELVAAEVWRIEDKFSRYVPGNIVDRINSAAGRPVELDPETSQLIDFSENLHELSAGRFDITSGVLRRVWTFDGSNNIPSNTSIKEVLKHVGWRRVSWVAPVLQMQSGMEIDLGGIGKEYAADRAATLLRDATTDSCLVNLGGDLIATRRPRLRDAWKVGIEAIDSSAADAAKMLNLEVGGLATSGDARRFLVKGGIRYSHILDPRTGWPIPDAPRSLTVAADTCTQAGMLSMLAMLKGAKAESFLDAQNIRYWCNRQAVGSEPGAS